MEEQTIINKQVFTPKITVKRLKNNEDGKANYVWDITMFDDDTELSVKKIVKIDKKLRSKFIEEVGT